MLAVIYHEYLARGKPLQHYFHHYLIATAGLLLAINLYGSVTAWEVALFYFINFALFADAFFFAVTNYVHQRSCRSAVNLFIVGDVIRFFSVLHDDRRFYGRLVVHNALTFASLWILLFALLIYDVPVGYYFVAGIITHLLFDLINDAYELHSVFRWLWPFNL